MKTRFIKRMMAAALCLGLMLGCVLPAGAAEAGDRPYPVTGGNIYYSINNQQTYSISDCDPEVNAADIPAEINGVAVTRIWNFAFEGCGSLTRVTIPASVTYVEGWAFYDCPSLESIDVDADNPDFCSVDGVLFDKEKTKLISYPGGRSGAYEIPEGVTWIGNETFLNCIGLTGVTIPVSMPVDEIWASMFSACPSLTSINVPAGHPDICSVDGVVFSKDKTVLVRYPAGRSGAYEIPEGVTEIGNYTFECCAGLTGVTIPEGVTKIGHAAFNYCDSLTRLVIPEGVRELTEFAVNNCPRLETIWLPASLDSGLEDRITANPALKAIHVAAENPSYCSVDGVVFNKDMTRLLLCPTGYSGAYWVPSGVTEIGEYAFYDCGTLTYVRLPESVTAIGEGAFSGCGALKTALVLGNVTEIGDYAFAGCDALTDVHFRGTREQWESISIGSEGNDALTGAALHCGSIGADYGSYPVTGGNIYYYTTAQGTPEIRITDCDPSVTEADIPDEIGGVPVTKIIGYAFICPSLTRVSIPAGVISIAGGAFNECTALTDIEVAADNPVYSSEGGVLFNKEKTMLLCYPAGRGGEYAIPEGVSAVDNWAFGYNSRLTRLRIPASVTQMHGPDDNYGDNWYVISNCSGLTDIDVDEANPNYCSVDGVVFSKDRTALLRCPAGRNGAYEIPAGVTEIGEMAFDSCAGLTELSFPDGLTKIGDYALSLCHGLKELVFPEGVTEIGYCAMEMSNGLERVYIPASVRALDEDVFNECPALQRIDVAPGNADFCSVNGVLFDKTCTTLITYPDGRSGAYEIPEGVTDLGWCAFGDCAGLTAVTIPGSVEELKLGVFYGCSALTGVTIPTGVTKLPSYMFYECGRLRSVTLPAGLTEIWSSTVFSGCDWLLDVYYGGSREQWEQVKGREYLAYAEIHYNSTGPDKPDIPDIPDKPDRPRPPVIVVPETPPEPDAPAFIDVPEDAWYAEAVNALARGGILAGKGEGRFDPDGEITLAELSVIYCRLIGDDWENRAELLPDTKSGHWAKKAMERSQLGRSSGDASGDDYRYADMPALRGDAMTLLGAAARASGLPGVSFDLESIPDRADYTADLAPGEPALTYADGGHRFNAADMDAAYVFGLVVGVDAAHTCRAFGTLTRAQAAQMCYNMGWTTAGCLK